VTNVRWTLAGLGLAALGVAQGEPARYRAAQLECATFLEEVRGELTSTIGSTARVERVGRDGILRVRAAAGDSGIALTAWYDSLVVWRESPDGRLTPDTDGLVGGRWRGWLGPSGVYRATAVPFIPDEVAEVAELSHLLEDFFPLLPDSGLGGLRHHWSRRSDSVSTAVVQDSALAVRRETEETGSLEWDPVRGPGRWERRVRVTARIPPGGPFRRGLVTGLVQTVRVTRLADPSSCDG
jgi:hypothetical protein